MSPPHTVVVVGIGELLRMVPDGADVLGRLAHAAVVLDGGRVRWVGREADLPREFHRSGVERVDAVGRLVSPGLVESHAHPIYAGDRAAEFDLRARGATYAAIQAAGGGILATVRATRAADDDALVALTRERLARLHANGVTVCEAKSGYALDRDGEARLLRLLRRAGEASPVALSPTLLAHVPPPDLAAGERDDYVRRFATELVPRAATLVDGAPLAEALDVYCDEGAYTLAETRALLDAGRRAGLALRVHAEQFTPTGAAALAAELGARSVEHLEHVTDDAIAALARAGTVCTLLPGAALTLKLRFPDARRFLDAGCEVALGTDLNPGSSNTESLPLMMSLGCMQLGMSCAEAWRAVTVVAARSVGRPDAGRVVPGARGDLVVWNASDHRDVPYHFGVPLVERVIATAKSAGAR